MSPATLPAGTRSVRDVAYDIDVNQRFDGHAPADTKRALVIVMLHGGGWRVAGGALATRWRAG